MNFGEKRTFFSVAQYIGEYEKMDVVSVVKILEKRRMA